MDVSPVQLRNAPLPMRVTELGIVMDVSPMQSEYPLFVDYQYFTFKKVEKWIYWFNLHS